MASSCVSARDTAWLGESMINGSDVSVRFTRRGCGAERTTRAADRVQQYLSNLRSRGLRSKSCMQSAPSCGITSEIPPIPRRCPMARFAIKRRGVFLVLFICCFLPACKSKLTRTNVDKIKEGMTLQEVEAILGEGTKQS